MLKKLKPEGGSTSFKYWTTNVAAPEEAMKIVRNQRLELLPCGTSQGSEIYREETYPIMPSTIFPSIPMTSSWQGSKWSFVIALNVICDPEEEIIIPNLLCRYNGFAAAAMKVVPLSHDLKTFKLQSS